MIYLDNAATTLIKPESVIEAVVNAMRTQGNAGRGVHSATLSAGRVVYDTRVKIASMFNLKKPSNVIFTLNSTEALNIAINGTIHDGDKVVSTDTEHNSVLRPLYHLKDTRNIDLHFVKADLKGKLLLSDFEKVIDDNTKVVVVNHSSNLTGNINDIKSISDIAHKHNAIFIVDASQTAGTRKIDMEELGIDILCFTGHKGLYGPQGTGGLLIREGVEVETFKRGGSGVKTYDKDQPREYPTRLEAGTLNSHGIAGLSAAIDFINETGLDNIEEKERELLRYFYNKVIMIPGVKVYGDFDEINKDTFRHSAIVALNIRDYDSSEVSDALSNEYGIATRPGAHCAPRLHEAIGTKDTGAVRFSFSYFTTKEELDIAIKAIEEIAKEEDKEANNYE